MNGNKKAAEWAARQEEGRAATALGEINPCWITFWEIIYELDAERERLDAAEKAAQEAAGSPGGSAHA